MPKRRDDGALIPRDLVTTRKTKAAYDLRLAGLDWDTIAEEAGYKDGTAARLEVKRVMQTAALAQSRETRDEMLALENDRLDQLQAAWWPAAMGGDEKAANVVLKVMSQRAKYNNWEQMVTVNHNTALVVSGPKEEYIAGLRLVSSEPVEDGAG